MSISIADLGPATQQQALIKYKQQYTSQLTVPEKYHNQPCTVDGIKFDSKKEARRFVELCAMDELGHISNLRLQVDFTLQEAYTTPKGKRVRAMRYRADFTYTDADGRLVVEDVKGKRTDVYTMKRKMMLDKYGIEIKEV